MGRYWVPNELWATKVSLEARAPYQLFCRLASGKRNLDMTHKQLAEAIDRSERMVRMALTELRDAGMVTWERSEDGPGRSRPNVYTALPVKHWKAAAFKDRHPAWSAGSEARHAAQGRSTPGTRRRDTRHGVPTPGSTAPGKEAPGEHQGSLSLTPKPAASRPSAEPVPLEQLMSSIREREPGMPVDEIRRKAEREQARMDHAESSPRLDDVAVELAS